MKRRRIVLLLLGFAAAVILITLLVPGEKEPEPEYNGKRLSEWLRIRASTRSYSQIEEAENAIRQIGTNAVPYLLKWLQIEPSPMRLKIARSLPSALTYQAPIHAVLAGRRIMLAEDSVGAFSALGPNSRSAIPELVRLTLKTNSPSTSSMALGVLANLGEVGLPGLISVITNQGYPYRSFAIATLGIGSRSATNFPKVSPVLIQCLRDRDASVASAAATTLGIWRAEPAVVVPLLTDSLQNRSADVRCACLDGLSAFGAGARSAVSAMTNCLGDVNPTVRDAARRALQRMRGEISPLE